jgi:glycosyltransferase involved in cell wall biosynthesis
MRIGIEACTWGNLRGYGRFTRELVSEMIQRFPDHEFTLVVDQATAEQCQFPAGASIQVVVTGQQQTQAASADSARSPVDMWRLSRAVARADFDAFFFPTRYSFFPMTARTPCVVAFHDATGEQHPKLIFPNVRSRLFWRLKSWLARFQTHRMVTVSHDARSQLARAFRYREDRIRVISEGPNRIFQVLDPKVDAKAIKDRWALPSDKPLILYVGGISPHKNLSRLLQALAITPGDWHAVLVGDYKNDSFWGCYQELQELAGELQLHGRLTFTGYVPDEDLVQLYNSATCLVLPSFSEGFGLPVVEAMACGLPVAASNRNSLPEVLGDAGLLFDPTETQEIADSLMMLLADESLRNTCRKRGLVRAALYTWERGADHLMEVILEVARKR